MSRTVYLWGGPAHHQTWEVPNDGGNLRYLVPPRLSLRALPDLEDVMAPVETEVREYVIRRFASPDTGQEWWVGTPDGFPLDRISQHVNGARSLFRALGWTR